MSFALATDDVRAAVDAVANDDRLTGTEAGKDPVEQIASAVENAEDGANHDRSE